MKILHNTDELRETINLIMNDNSGKRIIIVAYVGNDAVSYIPKAKNIDLYCSTSIPGTNPSGLRQLKKAGVNLYEVKKLHSKIYWSQNSGVVIGSANLSNNGLSKNGNHEVGVFLPKNNFKIQEYISKLESKKITYQRIHELEKKYNLYILKNKNISKKTKEKIQKFQEWDSKTGFQWKIYPWSEEGDLPKDVKGELKNTHLVEHNNYDFMQTTSKNEYDIGGWVLNAREVWKGDELIKIKDLSWFIPEILIKSGQKNSEEYPYYWIKINENTPSNQPFELKDKEFKKAFEKSYIELTNSKEKIFIKKNQPSSRFLKLVLKYTS